MCMVRTVLSPSRVLSSPPAGGFVLYQLSQSPGRTLAFVGLIVALQSWGPRWGGAPIPPLPLSHALCVLSQASPQLSGQHSDSPQGCAWPRSQLVIGRAETWAAVPGRNGPQDRSQWWPCPRSDARLLSLLGSSSRPPDSRPAPPILAARRQWSSRPLADLHTWCPRWALSPSPWGPPPLACQLHLGLGHTKGPSVCPHTSQPWKPGDHGIDGLFLVSCSRFQGVTSLRLKVMRSLRDVGSVGRVLDTGLWSPSAIHHL